MVCVSVWTLPGRFQGSCLTWRRSFLVQFTFGSSSCWNSAENHTCKEHFFKKLSGIKNSRRVHANQANMNEPTSACCVSDLWRWGPYKEGRCFGSVQSTGTTKCWWIILAQAMRFIETEKHSHSLQLHLYVIGLKGRWSLSVHRWFRLSERQGGQGEMDTYIHQTCVN